MKRFAAVLLALTSCAIPLDPDASKSIPTELAVAKLQELLPTAAYVNCFDPRVTIDQADIRSWSVTNEALEFRTEGRVPFRLFWAVSRGAELVQVPLRYEVRVYMTAPGNERKILYHFNWKEETPARRAAELFESLRGDR
jgi:hypothetical protein